MEKKVNKVNKYAQMFNFFCLFQLFFGLFVEPAVVASAPTDASKILRVLTRHGESLKEIKAFTIDQLSAIKQVSSRERDPQSERLVAWQGPSLMAVLEAVLSHLSVEEKAYIDLIVLKNDRGERALIPRAFIVKYPFYLALARDGKALGEAGPLQSVAPWTSSQRIRSEGMALESLFVSRVTQLELTNYRDQYGAMFLKRRTDPAALRGERLFVQNCINCHVVHPEHSSQIAATENHIPSVGEIAAPAAGRVLASAGHPQVRGAPRIEPKELRALTSYLEAYRTENEKGREGLQAAPFSSAAR